jgi:hypothetical protein
MLDFAEYFKQFEALEKKSKALIIVDVQESFGKYLNDEYLDALVKYCENFDRIYQIFDRNDQSEPSWEFPNQYQYCSKEYGSKPLNDWDPKDLKELFHEVDMERSLDIIKSPKIGDYLVAKDNSIWLYVGNNHVWFRLERELYNMLKNVKHFDAEPVIVGGADNECLEDIVVACKYMGLRPELEYKYIYSVNFCPKGI